MSEAFAWALPYVLAFVAGFIVKAVDWLDDDKKSRHPLKYALGAVYGALIGHLIAAATFSVLFLAALVAQVFARKIDTAAHRVGFLTAALSLLFFGVPVLDLRLFIYFLVFAFLDEVDFIGRLRPLTEYRLFLKIGALVPILMGRWDYFAGIMAFDIGYWIFEYILATKTGKPKKRKPA